MTASRPRLHLLGLGLLAAAACDSPPPRPAPAPPPALAPGPGPAPSTGPDSPSPAVAPAPAPVGRAEPVRSIGMEEPFARLGPTGYKTLKAGWRALGRKDYGEARSAFAAVVSAYPDHLDARFQELRAAVLGGDLAAVPELWREILARDFLGYDKRLDRSGEMAALRASPVWTRVQAVREETRRAYLAGLDQGVLFVAREPVSAEPRLEEVAALAGGEAEIPLALGQEVFHFDPGSKRMRRLTATGGRVLALHRGAAAGPVLLLVANTLKKHDGRVVFGKPAAALLPLDTLDRSRALTSEEDATSVELCQSKKGEPIWWFEGPGAGRSFTLDATGSALVGHEEGCSAGGSATRVTPFGVEHQRPTPEGVTLSEDRLVLVGVDADRPVRATREIRPGSLSWSPDRSRFAYSGQIDRCKVVAERGLLPRPAPNALLVWDAGLKAATRVKAGVAAYESAWLDDQRLVFEARLEGAARLQVHDFSAEAGTAPYTLDTPGGAGLYGIPAMPCPQSPSHALAQ